MDRSGEEISLWNPTKSNPYLFQEIAMLERAVQNFANDLQAVSEAIRNRTVTQIKGTLQKKAFDEAGIVIQQQVILEFHRFFATKY